ncbi:MAG: hypothetical protein ACPLRW_08835 [Moorellales bacterium]
MRRRRGEKLEMVTDREKKVLGWIDECGALTLEQVGAICGGNGNRISAYRLVERLERKGWVVVRQAEWDKRERYVVLTKDGHAVVEAVEGSRKLVTGEYRPVKRARARQAIMSAWFLIRMVESGFPRDRLVCRADALAAMKLRPQDAPMLAWLVDEAPQRRWAVHLLWKKRYHQALEREVALIPMRDAPFHIVVYENPLAFARDRKRYAEKALWSGLHLFTPETLKRWAAWAARSPTLEADLGPLLRAAYPGASMVPPPLGSPGVCVLKRQGEALVVDMRFERVGAAAAVIRSAQSELREQFSGVVFVFADLAQLRWWALRLGDWARAVVENRPGEVYRVINRRPVLVSRSPAAGVPSRSIGSAQK